jgi:hypothetical protein
MDTRLARGRGRARAEPDALRTQTALMEARIPRLPRSRKHVASCFQSVAHSSQITNPRNSNCSRNLRTLCEKHPGGRVSSTSQFGTRVWNESLEREEVVPLRQLGLKSCRSIQRSFFRSNVAAIVLPSGVVTSITVSCDPTSLASNSINTAAPSRTAGASLVAVE